MASPKRPRPTAPAEPYRHPESTSLMRPEVGTQAQFKKRKPPKEYRYDSSLSPALEWDGQNWAREAGEALLRKILDAKSLEEAKAAAAKLKAMGRPFLDWAGKAERLSFEVPTLPLFVHERLGTQAILETLKGHALDKQMGLLFGDPQHSIRDQVLKAYEHKDKWVNRMILGDSLVVMNSLLEYEGMGEQVQMIYMDPPHGISFGSNFQPFVRPKREIKHGDDNDMTREPETVQDGRYYFEGRPDEPGPNKCWRTTNPKGLDRLAALGRLKWAGKTLRYKQYLSDFPFTEITTIWDDTARDPENIYAVQTPSNIIRRCMLMTTDPGDLVLDPTCGSGTTAYVAEPWGRRWITTDVSRVPLALARQRILTATYPWRKLKDDKRGPAGGFVYERKQNARGEEVGGIVPHITLAGLANDEVPKEEVLVDRPETQPGVTRVSGPFVFEATIPTPFDWEKDGDDTDNERHRDHGAFVERMIEILRKSPVLHIAKKKTVTFQNIRPPAKTLSLSAEATVKNGEDRRVAIVFGPESGAITEGLVFQAAKEAHAKGFEHLYVIGFAIEAGARGTVEVLEQVADIPGTYVQATPDLLMGDLLKNMRSSEIFSVCGLPNVQVDTVKAEKKGEPKRYQVTLLGLDVFDPVTMQAEHRPGNDVPAWLLDTDYDDNVFRVTQAFFPRTSAWDNLKKALKGEYEESVWEHLAGTTSAPFEAGTHRKIAVKVIDDRGNDLLVVEVLPEPKR